MGDPRKGDQKAVTSQSILFVALSGCGITGVILDDRQDSFDYSKNLGRKHRDVYHGERGGHAPGSVSSTGLVAQKYARFR